MTGQARLYGYHKGVVMDVLAVGICIIAMTIMMMVCLGSNALLDRKAQISQTARKYILKMEAIGYLTADDKLALTQELKELGASEIDLTGSTVNEVDYGTPIYLVIRGRIAGTRMETGNGLFQTTFKSSLYEFEERKMTTAKN